MQVAGGGSMAGSLPAGTTVCLPVPPSSHHKNGTAGSAGTCMGMVAGGTAQAQCSANRQAKNTGGRQAGMAGRGRKVCRQVVAGRSWEIQAGMERNLPVPRG